MMIFFISVAILFVLHLLAALVFVLNPVGYINTLLGLLTSSKKDVHLGKVVNDCPICNGRDINFNEGVSSCNYCGFTWDLFLDSDVGKVVDFASYDDEITGQGVLLQVLDQQDEYNWSCIVLFNGQQWECLIDPDFLMAEGFSPIEE